MVINYKLSEKKMDDRGAKSNFINKFVKAQRVDDSYWNINFPIRYTLMGFERNYQIKVLSKQIFLNKRTFYSEDSLNSNTKLNPFFVSGLIDAEGYFSVSIYKV
jgi:hypothetical protein